MVYASYVLIRIVPVATMPPKGLAIHAKLSIHSSIIPAFQVLQIVAYRIVSNVESIASLSANPAISTTSWSMDLANYAQMRLFVPTVVEIYAMPAIVDIISTMEHVNLASLIAQYASMLHTVKHYIRLREGLLFRSIVK